VVGAGVGVVDLDVQVHVGVSGRAVVVPVAVTTAGVRTLRRRAARSAVPPVLLTVVHVGMLARRTVIPPSAVQPEKGR